MNLIFLLQLVISVVVGGFFVAFQTLLAERAPQRIAGILLSIPSTLAIGLVFIALTMSASVVRAIAPAVPASFGVTLIFVTAYVYLAHYLRSRRTITMLLSTVGAIAIWLLLASPIAYFKIGNLTFSLAVYVFLAAVSHYFLAIRPGVQTHPINIKYTTSQKVTRAVVGGSIIGLTVFLAKFLGPFWGAVFSAFPAVYLSTLLIVHQQHGKKFLFHVAKALPIASPIFVVYTLVAQYTYPRIGIALGTLAAFALCALYPYALSYGISRKT